MARPDHPASNAERLNQAGKFQEALSEVEGLLAAQPDSTKFLRVKHQALMGLRRFTEAAAVIERARGLQPENILYRKMHAIALKDSGDDAAPYVEGPSVSRFEDRFTILGNIIVFPTRGCWQLSGNYDGDYLSFVVWVD